MPDPREDRQSRGFSRELAIVAAIVAVVVLAGAAYTLLRGPQPAPGAGGTMMVEERTTPSGALRPADSER